MWVPSDTVWRPAVSGFSKVCRPVIWMTESVSWWGSVSLPASDVWPTGAKYRIESVASRPSMCCMWAYWGFASSKSTSSTRGWYLLAWTWQRRRTGPGIDSQLSNESPLRDRRLYAKSFSCDATFVAVYNKNPIECYTSLVLAPIVNRAVLWMLQLVWCTVVSLTRPMSSWVIRYWSAIPSFVRYSFSSLDKNEIPPLECTYAGIPITANS